MQINTDTPVLHDCRCTISGITPPSSHGFYRGFIWHQWNSPSHVCLLPVEILLADTLGIFGPATGLHLLGDGEIVQCLWPIQIDSLHSLIDRFWATVQVGLA